MSQGRYNDVTIYSDNPIDVALKFQEYGADYIHIVDLDAARAARQQKAHYNIANQLDIPVQTGGESDPGRYKVFAVRVERLLLELQSKILML